VTTAVTNTAAATARSATTATSTTGPERPAQPARPWRGWREHLTARAATTPGRLAILLAACFACCLLLGAVGAWTAESHASSVHEVGHSSERLTVDAQQIYRDFADADATAASAFLSGGIEPTAIRQRYLADIAQAQRSLLDATQLVGADASSEGPLATLTAGVPTYTGLIETARADNRQQLPVGAAYLREASAMMRASLLPAADTLFEQESKKLDSEQNSAGSFPYVDLIVGLLVLGCLLAAARYLWLRTHRVLNPGLLGATLAVIAALLWTQAAVASQGSNTDRGRSQGSAQIEFLAQARIAAIRAHGDEALILVGRGSDPAPANDYTSAARALRTDLAKAAKLSTGAHAAVDTSVRDAATWARAHQEFSAQNAAGDYNGAVASVLTARKGSVEAGFSQVDAEVATAIGEDQTAFARDADAAAGDLDFATPGALLLTLLALLGCGTGIAARLREYR
jgi:hypothetical protein